MRFDGGTNVGGPQEDWSWEADRQGSQDSATKDSGIDTSSTFTSSEDSNRGDLPKVRALNSGLVPGRGTESLACRSQRAEFSAARQSLRLDNLGSRCIE